MADATEASAAVVAGAAGGGGGGGGAGGGGSFASGGAAVPAAVVAGGHGGAVDGDVSSRSSDVVALKLLLSNDQAGAVIGKGGAEIRALQSESGSKIKIAGSDDLFPRSTDRAVLIRGTQAAVLAAVELLYTRLYKDMVARSEGEADLELTCKVLIPESVAGLIIGRGGDNIKAAAAESGARLKLSKKEEMAVQERIVTIVGGLQQSLAGVQAVFNKMLEDPARSSYTHPTVYYSQTVPPVMMGAPPGYGFVPPGAPQYAMSGGVGFMQSAPMAPHTLNVAVPDAVVGAIVGKGGKTLKWLQRTTGTQITLSPRGEYVAGTDNRMITIVGPYMATQHAQSLITTKAFAAVREDGGPAGPMAGAAPMHGHDMRAAMPHAGGMPMAHGAVGGL